MAEIVVTKDNFEQEVLKSDIPVLVDFWATWCGPCQMIGPILEEIAEEYDGKIKVGKVNVDEQPELAIQFSINSIPALVLFENGEPKRSTMGFQPKEKLVSFLFAE
ncbi:MAG: thioredoxin [Clostridiales bacterium]|nr:thioredoxin [Clostridiales bacterium]